VSGGQHARSVRAGGLGRTDQTQELGDNTRLQGFITFFLIATAFCFSADSIAARSNRSILK
jgi:hypothetical protein